MTCNEMEMPNRNIFQLLFIISLKCLQVFSQNYNLGMCADAECSVPVAVGITTIEYTPPEFGRLGFLPNQEVIIYVRNYGVKKDLLGVEMNGKKGYVPKNFVRETKSLAKATVPANLEFMHTRTRSFVYHETSHLHMSTNVPPGETQSLIHNTVPSSFSQQQSMQSMHHSEVHLESSRQGDHSHFQASSDVYIAQSGDSRNFISQNRGLGDHSDFQASSGVYIAKNDDSRNFISQNRGLGDDSDFQASSGVYIAKSDDSRNFIPQSRGFTETPHFRSPSPSHFGSENTVASNAILKTDMTGNSDNSVQFHQTRHLPESQWQDPSFRYHSQSARAHGMYSEDTRRNFDSQSNNLINSHGFDHQSSHMHQTQAPHTTPHLASMQSQANIPPVNDQAYDATMALLQNQGYNSAGELTNELSNQQYSEKQSSSFQNVHPGNLGWNPGFHGEKVPFQRVPSEVISSGQNSLNNPSSSVRLDDISNIVDSLFAEDVVIRPSETVIPSDSSTVDNNNNRLAAKIDRIRELAESFVKIPDDQSKIVDEDEQEEDYTDYEVVYSSKPTLSLDKTEVDLNLGIKSEQTSSLDNEKFTTESEISQAIKSVQPTSESGIQNNPTDDSTAIPTKSVNKVPASDSVSKSETAFKNEDTHDTQTMKIPTIPEEDTHDKKIGAIDEATDSSSNLKDSKDDSLDRSTLEKSDDIESTLEENDSISSASITSDDFTFDNHENIVDDTENVVNSTYSPDLSDDNSTPDSLLNVSDIKEPETNILNAYQTRHLKDVESDVESVSPHTEDAEQIGSSYEFDIYVAVENTFVAIRAFVDALLLWVPEPLYTILMDLEKEGVSPKVTVFTVICSIPCIILMISLAVVKRKSKESKLSAKLITLERNFYNITAEKIILEEKLEKTDVELQISRGVIEEEKISSFKLKTEIDSLKQQLEETNLELEKSVDEADSLKGREQEFVELIHDHEKEHLKLLEQKGEAETKVLEYEETLDVLRDSLQEKEGDIQKLIAEKSEYRQANEIYEEKINQLQQNCNQLLQEAEVWNLRVKELTEKLSQESQKNEELEKSLQEKVIEIESLSEAVQLFKTFEEVGETDNTCKTSEEKLKYLKNSTHNLMKLQKQEEENKLLAERLTDANNRLLDIEVAIMDVKTQNDKLKVNYNQALQDKAEALTKLEVLTNYFKDKEIQMQKQLGVQEAVRQKTEEDATSAERRICLIEQENSSYKYQVASMKQEIEETERNLKSQIALQEKKAHENWLAARTAERKLEDTKQEVTQLRQRLTLLEREQENWANSTRDEIIRPVPKRIGNLADDSINTQDSNSSLELQPNLYPPPMMLPPDRPLPPLPPLPPFLPPFDPPPPFRPPPWNLPPPEPLPNSDFRMTPSDYGRGRESTPPRGRNSARMDGELGPRQSSPIADMKDSRNSTPPHLLPDFHDIPPHPSRPFYPPPPMGRTRYPMPPPRFHPPNFRRDYPPGPRRIESQDENNSNYGSKNAPVPPEDWHNSNSRV